MLISLVFDERFKLVIFLSSMKFSTNEKREGSKSLEHEEFQEFEDSLLSPKANAQDGIEITTGLYPDNPFTTRTEK